MATSEPMEKKQKTENEETDVFSVFHSDFLSKNPSFVDAIRIFKDEITALGAFEIGSCNAADPDYGYPFTKADCTLRPTRSKFAFANFFIEGFKILKKFIESKEAPQDGTMRMSLERLLKYLINREIHQPLADMKDCSDETELTVLLAFHLFSPLSPSSHFTVDNRKSNQLKVCPCKKRHGKVSYSDTSIGNVKVWHGNLDLIMEGADIVIDVVHGESESYTDTESSVEVKPKNFDFSDNSSGSCVVQLAAETIANSFYHSLLHPDRGHGLVPSIGISHAGLVFYFYDSLNDVLFGSTQFPLVGRSPFQLNFKAVIAVWLVVNHNYFCNGLSVTDLETAPKAKFFSIAKDKMDIYRNELKRGGVGTRRVQQRSLDPVAFVNAKFVVSPEVDELLHI